MVLLDTIALIWLSVGNDELEHKAQRAVARSIAESAAMFSSISIWEMGVLVRKKRYRLRFRLEQWRLDLINAGLIEAPAVGLIAAGAEDFTHLHQDPADHFIVATADSLKAALLTADRALLGWAGAKGSDARQ